MMFVAFLELLFFLNTSSSAFKQRTICSGRAEGCTIVGGRCACSKRADSCFNFFPYPDLRSCQLDLFKTGEGSSTEGYPLCTAAQHQRARICNPSLAGTKYCDGTCENRCCVVADDGCLPPTNIFVPAESCLQIVQENPCQVYGACPRKGFKCSAVRGTCPVLPCPREAACVVDEDYDPCQYMRCAPDKICVRERTSCNQASCPFTHRCHFYKAGCAACRQVSLQESYCANNFVARIRVTGLQWKDRWHYALAGRCDWYMGEVEYIVQQRKPSALTQGGNVTVLMRAGDKCSCLQRVDRIGQRYLMIGQHLDYTLEERAAVVYVPPEGYVSPWPRIKSQMARKPTLLTLHDTCTAPPV